MTHPTDLLARTERVAALFPPLRLRLARLEDDASRAPGLADAVRELWSSLEAVETTGETALRELRTGRVDATDAARAVDTLERSTGRLSEQVARLEGMFADALASRTSPGGGRG